MRSLHAVLLAVALVPLSAGAQPKKKDFVPEAQESPTELQQRKRQAPEKAAPKLGGEQFMRKSAKEQSEEKWQEAFKILKRLIEATPDSDPAKPELYYRLSEMYWEKASSTVMRAFDDEEKCLAAATNKAREQACAAQRKRVEDSAQKFRDQAIKIYKHIVQNFPRYPRLDTVLFDLGFNFQQKQQPEAAKKIYIELIKRYPRSERVPDTLLNVGELFFDEGKVEQALKAYRKVTTNYRDTAVYGYALYKLGWCYYNVGEHAAALREFVKVIEWSRKQRGKRSITLQKEALRDLVRAYVNIEGASPKKAIAFFRKVAGDQYLDMSEKLAELYADTGQFQKSNDLYRQLIAIVGKSYKAFTFQLAIWGNTRNIGKQVDTVKELKRLVQLWQVVKGAKDADPQAVAKDKKTLEENLRNLAVTYHRQSLKTKSDEDYALAYDLYKAYVTVFPDGEHAYEMTFYYAELLYKLKKWGEAADNYRAALESKPNGEFTEDAAHGQVLAYKKLLDVKRDRGTGDVANVGEAGKGVPQPKPLPEEHKRFIDACDFYKKYVKDSEYLIDIQYDAARIYYDFNHFDDAIPRFKDIAENHSNHPLAIFAANLLLDTYNLLGDIPALNKQVDVFLKIYTPARDEEFYALLVKLKKSADFKLCEGLERKEQWLKSAKCYTRFAKKYAGKEFADKAWYNAALNYERLKMLERSIEARLQLVNNYSESELTPKSLYQIAGNLHAIAVYSQAAQAYEYYYKNFGGQEEAPEAARIAAQFRQGLEEYDAAIANYLAFMKMVGRKDKGQAAEVFFKLGTVYETLAKSCEKKCDDEWDTVIRHYQKFFKDYKKDAEAGLLIGADVKIGNAYMAKKGRNNEATASKAYRSAWKTFEGLSTDQQKALKPAGLSAAAEARFAMAEEIYREFLKAPMKVFAYRNVKKYVTEMKKAIATRSKLVVDARKLYLEVIELRSPNWAISALARIGQMFHGLAEDIYNLPAPGSFNEEQVEIFKGEMTKQAEIPEGKAVESYILCLNKSQELRWVNTETRECERQLAKLKPGEYRYNAEQLVTPTGEGDAFVVAPLNFKLESEEDEQ